VRQHKDFRLKLQKGSMDEALGTFKGLAAVYNNVDLGGDRILRGAFTRTLKAKGSFPLLWQHKADQPIGKVTLIDSPNGLVADGQLLMSDPQARIAFDHCQAGNIKGMSIGYDVPDGGATIDDTGVRNLSELKLWEVSIVTFPMNEAATISSVKSLEDARRILSEAATSDDQEQMKQLRALLKDVAQLLTPDVCEECGGELDENGDCVDCQNNDALQAEDEKQAAVILQRLAFELKQRGVR
jgi:HK97 family phage prohead protease